MNNLNDEKEIKLIADAPSKVDLLGYSSSINALYRIITSSHTVTPFTVGIFGDWGSGKSTIMMQLASKLSDQSYPVVIFNPWKYENYGDIQNALIQTILMTIGDKDNSDKKILTDMLKGIAHMATKSLVSHISKGIIDYDKLIENYSRIDQENVKFINNFENIFTMLINDCAKDKRFIIFIDDLDRCMPENAIKIIEAIKLFLAVPKCIFIIGVDREILQKSICHRYGRDLAFSSKDYLEKIIQLPFLVPSPSRQNISNYITLLFNSEWATIHEIAAAGSDGNPRRIKRFVNSFLLLKEILKQEVIDDQRDILLKDDILAFVLMLQIKFSEIYQYYGDNIKDFYQLISILQTKRLFEREEVDRIKTTNPIYADILSHVGFVKFLRSTININNIDFKIGEEGLIEYFSITRILSPIKEHTQEYYLPEIKTYNNMYGSIVNINMNKKVYMENAGPERIKVIKVVREITGFGLKEAKDLVESCPVVIKEDVGMEDAERMKKMLSEVGATIKIL